MAKCLTVQQPFAWGIMAGQKKIENRGRPTKYRGPLWIHAGVSRSTLAGTTPEEWRVDEEAGSNLPGCPEFKDLVFGAILGVVDLVDCIDEEAAFHPDYDSVHTLGPWCWVLANVRPLKKPILGVKGQLGIWNYDVPQTKGLLLPEVPYRGWTAYDQVYYKTGRMNKGPVNGKVPGYVHEN